MRAVYKLIPVNTYDLPALEGWLERMAAQGLMLQRFVGPFARFRREQPTPLRRYRLEATPNCRFFFRPGQQALAPYLAAGWQYVCQADGLSLYCRDQTQAGQSGGGVFLPGARKEWIEDRRRNELFQLILLPILLLLVSLNLYSGWDYLPLALRDPLLLAAVPITLVCGTYLHWRRIRTLGAVRRHPDWEEARGALPPARLRAKGRIILSFQYLLLLAVLVTSLIVPKLCRRTLPLEQWRPDFPLLTLAQLEEDGYAPAPYEWEFQYTLSQGFPTSRYRSASNEVTLRWAPLTPAYYLVSQSGSTDAVRAHMTLQYFVLRFPALAPLTIEQLAQHDRLQSLQVPGADQFWVVTDPARGEEVFACRGNRMLHLTYYGGARLSEHYGLVAAMLTPDGAPPPP